MTAGQDEFALLHENADEAGLPWNGPPSVRRVFTSTGDQQVSALLWGQESPRVVLLHGGGQNAHTWDTVVLALGLPALMVDLPGHGHSSWRPDHDYLPWTTAPDLVPLIRQWAPEPEVIVGMSLGGLDDFSPLWDDVSAATMPLTLVRGGASAFVTDEDAEEFLRRSPSARVHVVPGAGHSVQSDAPLALASIIRSVLDGP
jgi:pimeloyl-ACP methyl ester carboxylesterase